jgi:hypothetical protein
MNESVYPGEPIEMTKAKRDPSAFTREGHRADHRGIRTLGLAERTGAFRNGRPVAVMALQSKQLTEALLKPGPPRVELTRGLLYLETAW